ncbi:MAG: hypothetical protein KDB68_14585 [Planctomycetes bacterium]|nr:hypothetical protein [Planctomycetota bacterium]
MKHFAFIFLLMPALLPCGSLFAHPLDDRAQMASEVVIVSDSRLEYVLDFRYVSVMASWSEFSGGNAMGGGLDANDDGLVTRDELKRRYNDLVDQMVFSLGISLDGSPIDLEPDFDRFLFENMDNPKATLDLDEGVPIDTFRIHYRFVFWWESPKALTPGRHEVEYYFTGQQTVVHTPEEQMIAFDARENPRERLKVVTYDKAMEAYPKLVFGWGVEGSKVPTIIDSSPPEGWMPPPESNFSPDTSWQPRLQDKPETVAELLPALFTLIVGCALALVGLVCVLRVLAKGAPEAKSRVTGLAWSGLLMLGGGVILLGACVRLGIIGLGV